MKGSDQISVFQDRALLLSNRFVPLALTVAVAMSASYFVSMGVTPVACRFFLGGIEHKGFWKRVEALYQGALAQPPEKRSAFLAQACPEDSQLRDSCSQ